MNQDHSLGNVVTRKIRTALPLIVICVIAASLRLQALGRKSLWLDEVLSWRLQSWPLTLMLKRTAEPTTVHPPLYFAVLHVWSSLFGDSEFALRSLAVAAGTAAVLAVYFLVKELLKQIKADTTQRDFAACLAIDLALKAGLLEPSWHLLNGLGRHRLQSVLIAGHGVFRLLFVVSGLLLCAQLESALIGLIVATVWSSCLAVVCLRSESQAGDSASLTSESLRRLLTPWLKFSLLVDVLNHVLVFVSLWVLKATPDDSRTGAYAACQMLVQPLLPLGLVLSRAAFAPFARAIAESRWEEAILILSRCTRWAALFVGLGYVVTQQSGSFLLSLIYGSKLASEGHLLGRLFLGMSGLAMTSFCCEMMAAGYWLSTRCRVIAGVTLVAVPLSVVLVRCEGSSGAALATLLTGLVGMVVVMIVLKRLIGPFVCWRSLIHAGLATALASVVGTLLISSEGVLPELTKLVFVTGCYVVTIAMLSSFPRSSSRSTLESQS